MSSCGAGLALYPSENSNINMMNMFINMINMFINMIKLFKMSRALTNCND